MTNSSLIRRAAVLAAAVLLLGSSPPARAGNPFDFLDIIESSSTVLSATFNLAPLVVINTGPDQWTITLPGFQPSNGPADWIEPTNPLLVNRLTMDPTGHQVFVVSDTVFQPGDMITTDGLSLNNAVGLITTYHDRATDTVPESGATFVLMGLALTGLLAWRAKTQAA
ncbi:MAG: VPDSG-CTERM sorting domain-containing protein [Chthoniobacterales bacterium]